MIKNVASVYVSLLDEALVGPIGTILVFMFLQGCFL